MKILEILLPKGTSDRELLPGDARKIDLLQKRMDSYVDKIMNPATSPNGKEFLKNRLRSDYHELRDIIPRTHAVAENQQLKELFSGKKEWTLVYSGSTEFEAIFEVNKITYTFFAYKLNSTEVPNWWDVEFKVDPATTSRRPDLDDDEDDNVHHKARYGVTGTGNAAEVFGVVVDIMRSFLKTHPEITQLSFSANEASRQKLYKTMVRRLLPDWELETNEIEFTVRKPPSTQKVQISEAVTKLPLTDKDFEMVKELMLRPIPAAVAPIYISEIIEDDELDSTLLELEDINPAMDVRPIIAEWFKRVMPDQLHRFTGNHQDEDQREGLYSPVHGYDPRMYKGTNNSITGNNAFGSMP